MATIRYSGYRFPPTIIQQSVWLYLRFTLSFRDVEDLLAERSRVLGAVASLEGRLDRARLQQSETPIEFVLEFSVCAA